MNSKEKKKEKFKEKGDLTIGLYDFNWSNYGELSFNKDDVIIVTNWNFKDGWSTGYKRNNLYEQGNFPSVLVCQYNDNNQSKNNKECSQNQKDHSSSTNNNITTTTINNNIDNTDGLPTFSICTHSSTSNSSTTNNNSITFSIQETVFLQTVVPLQPITPSRTTTPLQIIVPLQIIALL